MSLFTRSFRRETKRLLQYRPSILGPSLETFKINFKSFLYSFHIPSIPSFFFFLMRLPWPGSPGRGGLVGVGWRDAGGWSVVQAPSLLCPQLCTRAWLPPAHCPPAPDALSLPAVWQTFPFVCAPCVALITLLKAKLDLYGRRRELEASEWLC